MKNFGPLKQALTMVVVGGVLSACQPQQLNAGAQQQGFVCKSLIEGFLKTQNLAHYELKSIQPTLQETAMQRTFVYQTASDHAIQLKSIPSRSNLQFHCQQTDQHYALQLITDTQNNTANNRINLISLQLPATDTIKQLTAYSLKTR